MNTIDQYDPAAASAKLASIARGIANQQSISFADAFQQAKAGNPELLRIANRQVDSEPAAPDDMDARAWNRGYQFGKSQSDHPIADDEARVESPARERTLVEVYHKGGAYSPRAREWSWNGARMVNRSAMRPSEDDPLPSGKLAQAIDDHRNARGFETYEAARNDLRNRRPGLFGC